MDKLIPNPTRFRKRTLDVNMGGSKMLENVKNNLNIFADDLYKNLNKSKVDSD